MVHSCLKKARTKTGHLLDLALYLDLFLCVNGLRMKPRGTKVERYWICADRTSEYQLLKRLILVKITNP